MNNEALQEINAQVSVTSNQVDLLGDVGDVTVEVAHIERLYGTT